MTSDNCCFIQSAMNSKSAITAVTCIVMLALSTLVQAAELSANSRAEIQYLLTRLGNSDCQFNRNGNWYSASADWGHSADWRTGVRSCNPTRYTEQLT
jgi:uncharacterized membrane protein